MGGLSSKSKENVAAAKSAVTKETKAKPSVDKKVKLTKETASATATKTPSESKALVLSTESTTFNDNRTLWSDEELLSQLRHIDRSTSKNIIKLFDDGNTIPFICRYRREMINHMDADE